MASRVLLALFLTTSVSAAESRLVDGLVASVAGEAVLRSDVAQVVLLSRAEAGADDGPAVTDDERRRALDRLVDELVVVAEAKRLSLFSPDAEEVAAARERLVQRSPGLDARWRAEGWSDSSLDAVLFRRLQADRYLESRARFGRGAGAKDVASSSRFVAELRRRAQVVVTGFVTGAAARERSAGRISAAEAAQRAAR